MKLKTMIKQIIMAIAISGLLFACSNISEEEKITLDVSLVDQSIDPATDFYTYVNNGWMNKYPLPDDESRYSSFDQLNKETSVKVNTLVEELAKGSFEKGSIEQKISDFYSVGMDTVKLEEQGISPIQPELDRINNITTIEQVQEQIAHFHLYGIGSAFGFFVSQDAKDSENQIAQLRQGGLGMSDRDYYISNDPRSTQLREAYVPHVAKMLLFIGMDENTAKQKAEAIMKLETRLAKASMTRLERRDPHKTYNVTTLNELNENYSNINWEAYFKSYGIDDPGKINVGQPIFFAELNKLINEISVDDWKSYFEWNLINEMANYLSSDIVAQNFEFYGKVLTGKEKIRPRWRRVLNTTSGALGEAIGQKFVEKHFPPEAKVRMVEMVDNLKAALAQRIDNLEWMSYETKEKAKDKLADMRVKIGYPDKWEDYSDLDIGTYSYAENVLKSSKWQRMENINELGKPMDKEKWFFPPQTVNAYYAPTLNEICFPAGILQPPFFYLDGDDAINYGAIGAVIGHEMTHGFDDQGRLYDKYGNLEDWWTDEDSKRFNERTEVLVEQFNQIVVLDTVHADGKLTLGENIADLGGLNIAYTGFMNVSKDKEQNPVDGFTPEQRFFMAWGRVWAQNIRDEEILRRTKEDVHSLGNNRINGPLKNMPEFHTAFSVEPGDELYLSEEEIASIW